MSNRNAAQTQVLEDETGLVVIYRGTRVHFNASGGIDVYGSTPVERLPVLKDPAIGEKMPDGTKFAGISPDTGKPMYTLSDDAAFVMKWKRAMKYAATFEGNGRKAGAFRLPSGGELNVLFESHAAIGGFVYEEIDDINQDCDYWSSDHGTDAAGEEYANIKHFSSGDECSAELAEGISASVRLVCD